MLLLIDKCRDIFTFLLYNISTNKYKQNRGIYMNKSDLLFYEGYEEFYRMATQNRIFSEYCEKAFGIDFTQDGFSDLSQVNDLIQTANIQKDDFVLDIGCGNGKMAEYVQQQTKATVYGFDYSDNAINDAKSRTAKNQNLMFDVGSIGEIEYQPNMFDAILSVDTMYFATNMKQFVMQIYNWLKPNGVFIAYYGEGHLSEALKDKDTTELGVALRSLKIPYEVIDYTKQHYQLMQRKYKVANEMKEQFSQNGMEIYYNCAIGQSVPLDMTYDEFQRLYNRYMYIIKK